MAIDFQTPEWVKHAVFYQVFPDRFAFSAAFEKPANLESWDSPPTAYGFKGGDLYGVVEKLDYLHDLGITALYLNPIFQSASNHRYHTHDYFQVDPLLGGNAAFALLLKEAHQRGMRVVLDGVFNHASRGFFQFNHILETEGASSYIDWFTVHGFPLNAYQGQPNYDCWAALPALPKFNLNNPQVRRFIFDVARYWLEQGADGWRLDVPYEIKDDAFWQEFRRVVKATNPDAYIVGEVAWEAQHWLQGDQFDAVMNYQFTQACLGFFAAETIDRNLEQSRMGLPPTQALDAPGFARRAVELLNLYPRPAVLAQLNLLGSHDMPRFAALASYDQSALWLATLFQMTYPGAPCVYYGDEIGLRNGPTKTPEDCRYAFPWDPGRWDQPLWGYFARLIAIRKAHPALRTGEFQVLLAEGSRLAYGRQEAGEKCIVAINASRQAGDYPISLPAEYAASSHWKDELSGQTFEVKQDRLTIPEFNPRSGMILFPI
jgi:cyclomaltodextrinase